MAVHPTSEPVASISWHMKNEQQLLTCTNNGIVELVQLRESIPLCWGPFATLVYTRGTQMVEIDLQKVYVRRIDIGGSLSLSLSH